MLVTIDESGDAGMKLGAGSSRYFCITAVIFEDAFTADSCDRAVDELRRTLQTKRNYEFHFTDCSARIRDAFFQRMRTEGLCYHAFIVNKEKLYAPRFGNAKVFYEFAVSIVCENARELLRDAKVIIDEHGNLEFKRKLQKTLKDQLRTEDGTSLIREVKMEASHTNNLVQVADMVCGAVARSITHPNQGHWRSLLQKSKCERRVQFWPK
jgi:nucleoside-triphosphatase THEP1